MRADRSTRFVAAPLLLLCALALASACTPSSTTAPGGGGSANSNPGSSTSPGSAGAREVKFEEMESADLDGQTVALVGYFAAPSFMTTYTREGEAPTWRLDFGNRPGAKDPVSVSVTEGTGPNTMRHLGTSYKASDLVVNSASGQPIGHRDRARVVGKVSRNEAASEGTRKNSITLVSVEPLPLTAAEREPTPINAAGAVDRALDGKIVSIEGYLSAGSMVMTYTSGDETFYDLSLTKSPNGYDSIVSVRVPVGTGASQVEELPENYSASQLRIHAEGGKVVSTRDRVRVVGDLAVEGDGEAASGRISYARIEPAAK